MRHQDADRTVVERREDIRGVRPGDPHDAGCAASACAKQRGVDGHSVEGSVLLVDDDEVETGVANDF
jgi:hypothetical protein